MYKLNRFLNIFSVVTFVFFFIIFVKCARAEESETFTYEKTTREVFTRPSHSKALKIQDLTDVDLDNAPDSTEIAPLPSDPIMIRENERSNERAILEASEE